MVFPVAIKVLKLPHGADMSLPFYATPGSAGFDLMAAIEGDVMLKPLERILIPCGFALTLPVGYEAQIRPRSGLALKNGLTILNTPGTVDSDYRGEIKVVLINLGQENFVIQRGMRVAQMIIAPYTQAILREVPAFEEESHLERSVLGFGSTGL